MARRSSVKKISRSTKTQRRRGGMKKLKTLGQSVLFVNRLKKSVKLPKCPICTLTMHDGETKTLPCTHEYHEACIDEWMTTDNDQRHNCPLCRVNIPPTFWPDSDPQKDAALAAFIDMTDHGTTLQQLTAAELDQLFKGADRSVYSQEAILNEIRNRDEFFDELLNQMLLFGDRNGVDIANALPGEDLSMHACFIHLQLTPPQRREVVQLMYARRPPLRALTEEELLAGLFKRDITRLLPEYIH